MFSDSFGKKKAEAKSKGGHGKSSLETDMMQNSGYHTNSTNKFPTIEEWVAKKDEFRVVGLGHTRPFPLVCKVSSNTNLIDYDRKLIAPHLSTILTNHKIAWNSIGLKKRLPPGSIDCSNQENGHDMESLLISTTSENTLRWKTAAIQIFDMYLQGGWLSMDIEVEIYNPLKMTWNRSHILDEDNVVSAFNSLRPAIEGKVESLCRSAWSSIAFHNRTHVGINPGLKKPTVVVFFNQGSQCDFEKLDDYFGELLGTADLKLFHEFQVGSVIEAWSITGKGKECPVIPETPPNGASIALQGDTERAGTLGGWLMLNIPKFPPIKVAVSCYHLIRSTHPNNIQKKMDREGLTPFEAKQNKPLSIVYPATLDREATVKKLDSMASKPQCSNDVKQNLKNNRQIFANPPIGQVIAASGMRTNGNGRRMDWVLIEVPGKTSRNNPPPRTSHTPRNSNDSTWPENYKITTDSVIRQFDNMSKGLWVVKQGRTTETTFGRVNKMSRTVKWSLPNQQFFRQSQEVEVHGIGDAFAYRGDSGSFVCDENGALVGLLFAMDLGKGAYGCGYVTPIREIQADVKATTGGFLTLDP